MDYYNELLIELSVVQNMEEGEVCSRFNTDSKEEYIQLLLEEIEHYSPSEQDEDNDESEEERFLTQLCVSQGISRYC